MDELATPEVAVFAEMFKFKIAKALRETLDRAIDRPEVGVELDCMMDVIYSTLPGTTHAKDGTIGITLGMTDTEINMAIVLEESKRMRSEILYRSMATTSAARLRKRVRSSEHIWYGCVLNTEYISDGVVEVYIDATPILP